MICTWLPRCRTASREAPVSSGAGFRLLPAVTRWSLLVGLTFRRFRRTERDSGERGVAGHQEPPAGRRVLAHNETPHRRRVRGADSSGELVPLVSASDSVELIRRDPAVFRPVIATVSPGPVDDLLDEERLANEGACTIMDDGSPLSSILDHDDAKLAAYALAKLGQCGDLFRVWLVGDVAGRLIEIYVTAARGPLKADRARSSLGQEGRAAPAERSATMVALCADRRRVVEADLGFPALVPINLD